MAISLPVLPIFEELISDELRNEMTLEKGVSHWNSSHSEIKMCGYW